MIQFTYQNPTKILFGMNMINQLGLEVSQYGKKVLLVYGGKSYLSNQFNIIINRILNESDIEYIEFGGVSEPSLYHVNEGIALCHQHDIDVVIGIGGGCCIDVAKAIAVGAKNDCDIWSILSGKKDMKTVDALPIGAIVTIPGSGSEMDGNSEIINTSLHAHGGIGSFIKTYPKFSILDPQLTLSIPYQQTLMHSVTIIIQALEQYFCDTEATPIQDGFIETVVKTVMNSIETLRHDLHNQDARGQLMWASALVTNRILGRGKAAPWLAGPLGNLIEEPYHLSYAEAIALIFPKYMQVCYKDHIPLFKQFAYRVMEIDSQDLSCDEIAKEGTIQFQKWLIKQGVPLTLSELKEKRVESLITESQLESIEMNKGIVRKDLKQIIEMTIGG